MMTFVAVVHILVAVILIGLVLIQDSKGGGALGIGGGGSNSLLGATGAQTLAARMTRWTGVLFAVTCITLTLMTAKQTQSVVDGMAVAPIVPASSPQATPGANAPTDGTTTPIPTNAAPVPADPGQATPPAETK